MKFFLDTCDIEQIKELIPLGVVDGVTTNPSIIAKSGHNFFDILNDICAIVKGPVSAEVVATNFEEMMKEAEQLLAIAKNITIKVPLTYDGLKACKALTDAGNKVNVTLCFNTAQAIMAAKAGATYVSPFIGRIDDIGLRGLDLIADIAAVFKNSINEAHSTTKILAASIRSLDHIISSLQLGADVVTCPPKLIKQMISHPLTEKGLQIFLDDWKKATL